MSRFARYLYLVRWLCLSLTLFWSAAQADVRSVRVWQSPESTRLVFDLTAPVKHKIFPLSNPSRVVIDLTDARILQDVRKVDLDGTTIKRIRTGKRGKGGTRVVLDLNETLKPSSFALKPNDVYKSHRLVIDLKRMGTGQVVKPVKKIESRPTGKRNIIIAIDAGHGGEDPGATGPKKTREKHVVLAIAKELEKLFKKQPGFKPFMVRTGDYYIGLRDRTEKARAANADFFVSIHADAFKHPSAHGSSVYVLSDRGATSETARWLADKENKADLIGGVSLEDKDDDLKMTLLDLSMTYQRNSSKGAGSSILGYMGKISRLHKKRVEEAAFAVLKAPDMPALLVETGFISNPKEEKNLGSRRYQRKMAAAIFKGISDYFRAHPPEGTLLASRQSTRKSDTAYVVRNGDTLSDIAVRNGVKIRELRRVNQLNNDVIQVGQKLRIPKT